MSSRTAHWLLLLGVTCSFSGCARSPYGTVPVSGRVTFAGRNPPAACELYFTPVPDASARQSAPVRAGRALASADGSFVVSSFREGDGLLPGAYDVRLVCWRTPPVWSHDGKPDVGGVSFVPVAFAPRALVIDSGSRKTVRYDLDVPETLSRP